MAEVFEMYLLRIEVRSRDGSTVSFNLELTEEADDRFQKILIQYGRNTFLVMNGLNHQFQTQDFFPWAIIALPKQYMLRGYVAATRPSKEDLLMGPYSVPPEGPKEDYGPVPVGVMLARTKQSFDLLDFQSPFYASFHDLLANKDPDRHWICFPDPLPEDWVQERESE
ncbi:MAG: hypothetical protein AAGU05_06645, partial [Anaerolineaceae bacterium]